MRLASSLLRGGASYSRVTVFSGQLRKPTSQFLMLGGAMAAGVVALESSTSAQCEAANAEPAPAESEAPKRQPLRKRKLKKKNLNPGKFEDAARESKNILEPQTFGGGRFSFNRAAFPEEMGMQSQVQKQCIGGVMIWLSPQIPEGGAVDLNTQTVLSNGKYVLAGQMSLQGDQPYRSHGRAIAGDLLGIKNLSGKVVFNIVPENPRYSNASGDIDYKGEDFSTKVHVNQGGSGALEIGANYLQALTPTLSAGVEIDVHQNSGRAAMGGLVKHSTLKKQSDGEAWCAQLQLDKSFHLTYTRQVDQSLSLSSSLQYLYPREANVSAGFMLKKRLFQYHGNCESSGKVSSLLEMAILSDSGGLRFSLSAELNQFTHESMFGYGVSIG